MAKTSDCEYHCDLCMEGGPDPRIEVAKAKTLGQLMEALQIDDPHDLVDWTSLPWFGGLDPVGGTSGVWSGDEKFLLIGPCADDLEIVSRRRWEKSCERCGTHGVGLCEECTDKELYGR